MKIILIILTLPPPLPPTMTAVALAHSLALRPLAMREAGTKPFTVTFFLGSWALTPKTNKNNYEYMIKYLNGNNKKIEGEEKLPATSGYFLLMFLMASTKNSPCVPTAQKN